jgi:signal transduction histidine kinase
MQSEPTGIGRLFLSTHPAGRRAIRWAMAAALASAALFTAAVPFARMQLPQVPAFIPIYESALVICDLITAMLLFGQYRILHTRALCVLAGGYLFTATITIAHALTFPGLFTPTGLLGAGAQTTAWLYMAWHAGFPLVVIAYALLKDERAPAIAAGPDRRRTTAAILGTVAGVVAIGCGIAIIATAGHEHLPVMMQSNRYTDIGTVALSSAWLMSFLALAVLLARGPHTVLDVWLMVVMGAWAFDVALSAVFNGARFDLGWYAGRIYGLLAASVLLAVILAEYGRHYARLAQVSAELQGANASIERLSLRNLANLETQHQLEIQQEANQGLEHTSRMKSDFLATMSHELRTPLNAIIGFSEALKDGLVGPLSDEQREYVGDIFDSGEHLLSLINEILDLSTVEAGAMALHMEEVDVGALLSGSLTIVRNAAATHHIRVEFEPGEDLGVHPLDLRKTRQIVYNLLSNGVKFSADGGRVMLRAGRVARNRVGTLFGAWPVHRFALPDSEFDEFLEISVTDSGIGISAENMARLFQPFTQVDASLARKFEGTGLGLAMVKLLAELHGGTVAVASALKEGACFAVWLPLRPSATPA